MVNEPEQLPLDLDIVVDKARLFEVVDNLSVRLLSQLENMNVTLVRIEEVLVGRC